MYSPSTANETFLIVEIWNGVGVPLIGRISVSYRLSEIYDVFNYFLR